MSCEYPPNVEVLQALVKKPLYEKDMLAKGLRIWVILRTLFGEQSNSLKLNLDSKFHYTDWHEAFYQQSEFHPNQDSRIIPEIHDPKCPCAYSITDWLFKNPDFEIDRTQWCSDFKSLKKTGKPIDDNQLDRLLNPDQAISFKGYKQKKQIIKQEYAKIPQESIDLLFRTIHQIVLLDAYVSQEQKETIYTRFSAIKKETIDSIFQIYIDTKLEYDTHRPLGCARKSVYNIFSKDLVHSGFLEKNGEEYQKVKQLPRLFPSKLILHIDKMRHASSEVHRVSMADKLHNARSILADWHRGENHIWSRFKGGKEGTLWYFRSLIEID